MTAVNPIDILLVIVILLSVLNGYRRGFINGVIDLAGWVLSLLAGFRYYQPLARWLGTPIASTPRWDGLHGLERVRETIRALSAIPDAFRHNDLVAPADLRVEDGRIAFLYENQAVCLWATEPEGDDPRVWYRTNANGEPWIEEPERLSGFLVQAVLFEAIMHAPFGANTPELDAQKAAAIVDRLRPLAGGRWNWFGARFYARDGALALTMENPPGVDVWLAAATPLALTPFDDLVTADWQHVAF